MPAVFRQIPDLENSAFVRTILNFEYFGHGSSTQGTDFFPAATELERERAIIYDEIVDFFTDVYFLAPLEKMLKLLANAGAVVYFYTNDFRYRISETKKIAS